MVQQEEWPAQEINLNLAVEIQAQHGQSVLLSACVSVPCFRISLSRNTCVRGMFAGHRGRAGRCPVLLLIVRDASQR